MNNPLYIRCVFSDDPKDRVTIQIVKESLDAQRMVSHVVDELKSKRDKEEDPQFWIDGLDDDDDGIECRYSRSWQQCTPVQWPSISLILLNSGDLSGAAALLSEAAGEQPSDQRQQLQKLDLLAAAGAKIAALADKKRKRKKKDAPNHGEAAMLSNASKTGRKPFKPPRIGKAAATDDTAAAAAAAVPCSGLSTRGSAGRSALQTDARDVADSTDNTDIH
ncbi:hypothetical protein COO60DRAFT_1628990 [Scenedesmus sp. NREL 46B-D3]|nr:hypothetical protein COO60DRAFT_1628990 [Scenedesmus sp. NREL 46B-D3]